MIHPDSRKFAATSSTASQGLKSRPRFFIGLFSLIPNQSPHMLHVIRLTYKSSIQILRQHVKVNIQIHGVYPYNFQNQPSKKVVDLFHSHGLFIVQIHLPFWWHLQCSRERFQTRPTKNVRQFQGGSKKNEVI